MHLLHLLQYKLQEHQPLVQEHQLLLHQHQLLLQKGVGLQVEGETRNSVHQDLLLQLQMFWLVTKGRGLQAAD